MPEIPYPPPRSRFPRVRARIADWRRSVAGAAPGKEVIPSFPLDQWLAAYQAVPAPKIPSDVAFGLLIDARGSNRNLLDVTLRSAFRQCPDDWQFQVVLDEGVSLSRRRRHHQVRSKEAAMGALERAEHVIFLEAGTVLADHALAWIGSAAPQSDVVYGDGGDPNANLSDLFNPGWSPRLLRTRQYIGGVASIRRPLLDDLDLARPTGLHDLLLQLSQSPTLRVTHLPVVLSIASGKAPDRSVNVFESLGVKDLHRNGSPSPPTIPGSEQVKVVIPTRDGYSHLREAVRTVMEATGVPIPHVVIVDNGSRDQTTLTYLDQLAADGTAQVVRLDEPFNFARLCNTGAAAGPDTPYLLFLNNDVSSTEPEWLAQLLGWLVEDEGLAAVGPQLRYPNGRIQYGGTVIGMGGVAGHYAANVDPDTPGLHRYPREVGALTAACLLVKTTAFEAVKGFPEEFPTDFQDVDFSLKLRAMGGQLLYDPTYPLVHHEGASRGRHDVDPAISALFLKRWGPEVAVGDPYYNPHLADAYWDQELGGWVHDPNRLRGFPDTVEEAMTRLEPRRSGA